MRVDEGSNSWSLLATKNKARTAVGKGGKSLLSDPGSELRLQEGRRRKKRAKMILRSRRID